MGIFNISGHINRIARITNKWIMTLIALIISYLLLFQSAQETWITLVWVFFIIISTIFTLNGILLILSFNVEVKKFKKKGKPVQGIIGFNELSSELKKSAGQSFIITFASILSFVFYYLSITNILQIEGINQFLDTLALAMTFVAISVMFLVSYPSDPSFTPGGLIGFYEPDNFPIILDNLLGDVFTTYLDPATFMRFDECKIGISNILNSEFEADEPKKIRIDRAIEKILLLAYLANSNGDTFDNQVIDRELSELFPNENLDKFKGGHDTGLEWKEILNIIDRIEEQAPEPFRLVDRLMINLSDNYDEFVSNDLYFTVAGKINQGSVKESTGILAFFLNKTPKTDRLMHVKLTTDITTVHPSEQDVILKLDAYMD